MTRFVAKEKEKWRKKFVVELLILIIMQPQEMLLYGIPIQAQIPSL